MSLSCQCPVHSVTYQRRLRKTERIAHEIEEEATMDSIHSILMLSLQCFEKLFGSTGEVRLAPEKPYGHYVESLQRLLSK